MIKALCSNSSGKPKEIPTEKWIKSGQYYHVTHIYNMCNQGNILGCSLYEIDLTTIEGNPYECFRLDRFIFDPKDIPVLVQLILDCGEFNDIETIKSYSELLEKNVKVSQNNE